MYLPEDFIKNIQLLMGEECEVFHEALQQTSPVSIRFNPKKKELSDISLSNIPWCRYGYYLDKRPAFTFDPLFHAGTYYVQEASSMFIEQVFKQYLSGRGIKVLDLCAAPGGKSTHIASLISDNSLLVSNEVIRSRSNILSENITKAGYPNVIVTNNDPATIGKLTHFFDVILVDAPCSGEGMFRKDMEAIKEWSLGNVQLCMERQQRIVADVWNALKPDGVLIYSTCTYNRMENEDNVAWVRDSLGAEILSLEIDPQWNISPAYDPDISAYHFFPHKTKGEGFFLAVLRKRGSEELPKQRKNRTEKHKNTLILSKLNQDYLMSPNDFTFFNKGDLWFAFPTVLYDGFKEVVAELNLVSAGIYLGETKGKDFIPHHSLAMSTVLNRDAFPQFEVNKDLAIAYLRKEALNFSELSELPKGYILLTYENKPLGFIKNIGNRANNLYPNEWRIRSAYRPDSENTDN